MKYLVVFMFTFFIYNKNYFAAESLTEPSQNRVLLPFEMDNQAYNKIKKLKIKQALALLAKGKGSIIIKADIKTAYKRLMEHSDLIDDFSQIKKINEAYQYLQEIFNLQNSNRLLEKLPSRYIIINEDNLEIDLDDILYYAKIADSDIIHKEIYDSLIMLGFHDGEIVKLADIYETFDLIEQDFENGIIVQKAFDTYRYCFEMLNILYQINVLPDEFTMHAL